MEKIRETLQAEYVDFEMRRAGEDFREEYTYNAGRPVEDGQHDHVGVGDQTDGGNYVGLSVPIGRLPAEDAIELADYADEYGSGEVRLTRRQNPVIVDVADEDLEDLLAEPLLEEYPAEPSPFERGAMACTGTEFCSIALTETKGRMARMLRWFNANVELPDDVGTIKMHYSGCTADCGQAMTADIGLQGMRARKDGEMVEAFDIGVGGGVGEEPSFIDWVQQRVPADEGPGAIRNLLQAYAAHRSDGQTFRQWVEATAEEQLVEFCEPRRPTSRHRTWPTPSSRGTPSRRASPRRPRSARSPRLPRTTETALTLCSLGGIKPISHACIYQLPDRIVDHAQRRTLQIRERPESSGYRVPSPTRRGQPRGRRGDHAQSGIRIRDARAARPSHLRGQSRARGTGRRARRTERRIRTRVGRSRRRRRGRERRWTARNRIIQPFYRRSRPSASGLDPEAVHCLRECGW